MKYNKITFAIIAFIIAAAFFISFLPQIEKYPDQALSLYWALTVTKLPCLIAWIGLLYVGKYLIELGKKRTALSHTLNVSRGVVSLITLAVYALTFKYKPFGFSFTYQTYMWLAYALVLVIAALAAAEIVLWLKKPQAKKAR